MEWSFFRKQMFELYVFFIKFKYIKFGNFSQYSVKTQFLAEKQK